MAFSKEYLLTYFQKFCAEQELLQPVPRQDIYIAASGGADSMFLLWALQQLGLKNLCALHVNYQTSTYSAKAQKLLQEFCKQAGIKFKLLREPMDPKEANFEALARKTRLDWFRSQLTAQDILVMGHHISDSLEWSWMQMLKSSSKGPWLGIAVKNAQVQRPLMCFTREQIRIICRKMQIAFCDDPSNSNTQYERNFIRAQFSRMQKRFPAIEKHYVNRHNQLALDFGKHVFNKKLLKNTQSSLFKKLEAPKLGGVLIFVQAKSLKPYFENIKKIIYQLSQSGRGVISEQLIRLNEAFVNGKEGPLLFSGKVHCFLLTQHLLILSADDYIRWKNWDQSFAQKVLTQKNFKLGIAAGDPLMPNEFICDFQTDLASKDYRIRKKQLFLLEKTTLALKEINYPWQTLFRTHLMQSKRQS